MPHVFEPAVTGRSKCRGCGRALERGELRFGERVANPFADGETTLWFHPLCAAYKRPEAMLEALAQSAGTVPNREGAAGPPQGTRPLGGAARSADRGEHTTLERAANASLARPRLPRIDGAERAKGQATCRQCRTPIPRSAWRIRLASYEEGQFSPLGFIHLACAKDYFETADILEHVLHFSTALGDADREELRGALTSG
jgi:hypothetical protein